MTYQSSRRVAVRPLPFTSPRNDAETTLPSLCTLSVSPRVSLSIDPSVWPWLKREADPNKDMLVLALDRHDAPTPSGWIVGILPIGFPGVQHERGFRGQLRQYAVLVPQRHHLPKLNGRLLTCWNGNLSIV